MPHAVVVRGKAVSDVVSLIKEGLKAVGRERVEGFSPFEYATAWAMLLTLCCRELGVKPSDFMKVAANFLDGKDEKPIIMPPTALATKNRMN